jgi:uncharacterized protein YndB with AHSA1/START domain
MRRIRDPRWYHFAAVGVGSMVGAFTLIGLVLPPHFVVQRSREIEAPPEAVWTLLTDMHDNLVWAPWKAQDPTLTYTVGPVVRGAGASYRWAAERVGSGSYTLEKLEPHTALSYRLEMGGREGVGGAWNLEQFGPVTKVTWTVHGSVGWNLPARYFILGADGAWGPLLELGLDSLERETETRVHPERVGPPVAPDTHSNTPRTP